MYCSYAFRKGFLAIGESGEADRDLMAKMVEPGGLVLTIA